MNREDLHPFQIAVMKMAETIKEIFSQFNKAQSHISDVQEKIDREKVYRSSWKVKRDTRLRSQVIDNKPKQLIKKVIR